ncbi:MAG: FtsW/RodA/SpoVE family cell cycle protein [Lachnospiraceae bacterium]|nr:putative lipid II flippase FtsW [Lachnospiraceae bacterium]MDD6617927.1 putative peptidoglycan glycosyltransferase FtsW [Clostridiales bacterium]
MATSRKKRKKSKPYYDYNLIAVILLLMCFGLIMLYSTSAYVASIQFNDDMYYFRKQAIISIASLLWAFVISRVDYHIYTKFPTLIYLAAAFLMFLVRTPLGVTVNGAKRWLKIGPLQFQPSELAKLAIILCLPYLIVKMGKKIATKKGFALIFIIGMMLGAMTFFFTDNLSTAVIVCGITAGMIFIAHPRTKEFLIALGIFAGVCAIGLSVLIANLQNSNNFRLQRILVWLHPEDYIKSDGYQIMQALYAIGSGGFLGKGLGNSVQKLGWVPEAQNDMIFSIICEEFGIFGCCFTMLLFGYLLYRLFFIAQNAADLYGTLVVSGIFIHIALQVILNICVVINLIPTTGITLPFISYGGTSVLFLMTEMGIALSVARGIKFQSPESTLETTLSSL